MESRGWLGGTARARKAQGQEENGQERQGPPEQEEARLTL